MEGVLTDLKLEHCLPYSRNTPSLNPDEIDALLAELAEWVVIEEDKMPRLKKQYIFDNFSKALEFTNRIGLISEVEDHHPAILTEWGKVTVFWWTHVLHGLHRNDFIMAAKTDNLFQSYASQEKGR
jgi:4a-hydroxytetrahydrobiopterin dehydratase